MFQLWRLNRDSADLLRWIGRMAVAKKRLEEAWMDIVVPLERTDPMFHRMVDEARRTGRLLQDPDNEWPAYLENLNAHARAQHQGAFPFTDNLFTLIFIVGTLQAVVFGIPDEAWLVFWKYWTWLVFATGCVIVVWFTVGGFRDLRRMYAHLEKYRADARDDGSVEKGRDA